ncbi:hypothetical protein B5S31_g2990 [[Candida] boidinii]|nr:hypothetical protein B5S31_g2990 [[Candida] boidinii]OWB76667.1 hypothetical protein B5S32_g822 [[Candida] boidinii]
MSLTSALDKFYFAYFLLHIPITIVIDSTLVIPVSIQHEIQKNFLKFHIEQNKDFLLQAPLEKWLVMFGLIEMIFQLPFFIICVFNFIKNKYQYFSNYIWPFVLLYGFNACFTTWICLGYVYFFYSEHGLNDSDMKSLIGVYFPTFLIPFVIMVDYAIRISNKLNESEHIKKE